MLGRVGFAIRMSNRARRNGVVGVQTESLLDHCARTQNTTRVCASRETMYARFIGSIFADVAGDGRRWPVGRASEKVSV